MTEKYGCCEKADPKDGSAWECLVCGASYEERNNEE